MKFAVASGKGGTGKTTVSVNLAQVFEGPVQLVDCDVEEPNAQLFLTGTLVRTETVGMPIPQVDEALCDGCGACGRFCAYHAIVSLGSSPLVFADLCHGCGGCIRVCPRGALSDEPQRIGVVETRQAGHIHVIEGRLDIGKAMAPPLIRAVKRHLQKDLPAILDAPPGTTCPVVAALRETDAVVLVTEPTPFGLHDLKLAVAMVRELNLPAGVVVNRAGIGDDRVHRYCAEEGLSLLAEIPDDRRIAEAYSRGKVIVDVLPEYREMFCELFEKIAMLRMAHC